MAWFKKKGPQLRPDLDAALTVAKNGKRTRWLAPTAETVLRPDEQVQIAASVSVQGRAGLLVLTNGRLIVVSAQLGGDPMVVSVMDRANVTGAAVDQKLLSNGLTIHTVGESTTYGFVDPADSGRIIAELA